MSMTPGLTPGTPGLQAGEPIADWSAWETHRGSVEHPATTIKPADLARARENIERYAWAKTYADKVQANAEAFLKRINPAFVERMIPETTPGEILFTPCPACRDKGKSFHPHGQWDWSVDQPEQITCKVCDTVFPHPDYPETVEIKTTWGKPQTLTFYGGEPFVLFSYKTGRPSFTGNVRARQVDYMVKAARTLAEAHALSGDPRFAEGTRLILHRLAEVFPYWLVHSGYGEFADMDPRVAAEHITRLPEPELTYPPNKPDRVLHTGYWTAGRARAVGMEGIFVRNAAEAYDLTCDAVGADGRPVYSDAERRTIERDLLLESTLLLTADKGLNNKSVTNATAAALVGMTVGHPELVRFGLREFERTVDEWFLPDGFTPESPAYAMMTLGGIIDLGQAYRGYSDPPGYRDAAGQRLEALDLYHDTAYEQVWTALVQSLQGDLHYPPFADSYQSTNIRAFYVEHMVANYPERPEYLALLKELAGPDLADSSPDVALYYREPGLEEKATPPLTLPDVCPPDLRIGFMRSGEHGRDGLLLLSASHWGGHHHLDSLNLYYWKAGHELLSDLGYLWDHPDKKNLTRSFAHNLVVIDGRDQVSRDRGGEVEFFAASPHVKAMRASSQAYADAEVYERTAVLIDHGQGRSYAVDVFRVAGGGVQDYVFHGPNDADYQLHGLAPQPFAAESAGDVDPVDAYHVANVRAADGAAGWRAVWPISDTLDFTAWSLGGAGEQVLLADGWGQRDHRGSDVGATLPYVIRRTRGDGIKQFVSIFEGHAPGAATVRGVQRLPLPAAAAETVALAIDTEDGTDYVVWRAEPGAATITTPDGELQTTSRLTVVAVRSGQPAWAFSEDESPVRFDGREVAGR